jgi:quercetin dioxygenase-like cupin family protein
MAKIRAVQRDALTEGQASPGIARDLAFKTDEAQVIRSRVHPGTVSGWHNHANHTVYGYVVSGTARLDSGPGGRDAVSIGPGGFFIVPPNTVHREVNPSPTQEGEVILFLTGTGSMTVNVDGPDPT